jgi:5-methylcytosine-specific restriction enzyme subunit McrC
VSTLRTRDLSPIEGELTAEDHAWLEQVQRHVSASDHVLRLGDAAAAEDREDFIVSRDAFGRWWAGRYIGDISLAGRRLEIRPRLGVVVIEKWLGEILNLVAVPESATRQNSESFIARLMGAVWCRAVDQASRHGPPAFRREHEHRGEFVRGRLDVRATARLRATGSPHVASTMNFRDLDNDVSRTIVAAERALSARIGNRLWMTPRVGDIVPQLRASVGSRPRLPTQPDLSRIRYTPITRRYKEGAQLSWRLARLQGYGAASSDGKSEGLLVDVAELWELFVCKAIIAALPELRVEHGTHATDTTWLLSSRTHPDAGLGRLKPDVLAFKEETARLVADAKYKRLEDRWPDRRHGLDRADLYQLTSYLARYSSDGAALGMLIFPREDEHDEPSSTAETKGPWELRSEGEVRFMRLATGLHEAVAQLRALFEETGVSPTGAVRRTAANGAPTSVSDSQRTSEGLDQPPRASRLSRLPET